MIKILRVDHRLLHGQVAFSWTGYLGANCILIASDTAVLDDLRKTTLKLAKPQSCKLIIKSVEESIEALNQGKADKYELFVVVENIQDAYRLGEAVDRIKNINIGNVKPHDGSHVCKLNHSVNLTDREEEMLRELKSEGKEIDFRSVPSDGARKL